MRGYFEGWYLKQQAGEDTVAFIPAFHKDSAGKTEASLQVITKESSCSVPFRQFFYDRANQVFLLGSNVFSREGCTVNCRSKGVELAARLRYRDMERETEDIMGPFQYLPFMQCRHSLFSMRHRVDGEVFLNGREYRFQNSAGYWEGDRGSSFPQRYVWTQCTEGPYSLMLSVADIPYMGVRFTGCIASILTGEKRYRIATYCGAKVIQADNQAVVVTQGSLLLMVQLLHKQEQPLAAPKNGRMSRVIHESAVCRVRCRLEEGGNVMFDFTSGRAAFEGAWG